jgi:hypothetical protein
MTIIENDERAWRLMNITLNPEKFVNQMSSGDYFDVSKGETNYVVNILFTLGNQYVALWKITLQEGVQVLCRRTKRKENSPCFRVNKNDYPVSQAWAFLSGI